MLSVVEERIDYENDEFSESSDDESLEEYLYD